MDKSSHLDDSGARPVRWRRRFWQGLALLAFAVIPAGLCQFLAELPGDRYIHVEAFRYGKTPSVIRCNRGDRLHLTFSSLDTGHSFFLEAFNVDAKIHPGSQDVVVFQTGNPEAPPDRVREVVFVAEYAGRLGWVLSKSQFRCHVWCGPMHAFEHGSLIIGPNTLLYTALGLLVGIPLVGLLSLGSTLRQDRVAPVTLTDGRDLFQQLPWLKRLVKMRGFQFAFTAPGMALLYVVVLTTLLGTHVSGRNLGMMLMWVVWLFLLAAVFTPLGGRIWCLACPLPVVGEALQRRALTGVRTGTTGPYRNRFFGLNKRWPEWLATAWPRTMVFLTMGTFSTVLVTYPPATAWVLMGMVVLAMSMSLIWELRAFCRYLCPINAFVGLYGMAGKLALRYADEDVCTKCKVHTCERGNKNGWACPYGLRVEHIEENNDCGLCTECVKSCAYDNVTLRWQLFANETRLRSVDEAFLAMSMLTLSAVYCLVHLGPWPELRDWVNIIDKGNWGLFAGFAAILWGSALVGLPGVMFLAAGAGKRLSGSSTSARELLVVSSGALVPIGLMLWIAFAVPMLFVNVSFIAQSLSDPFGWGWDFFGWRSIPWHQFFPLGVPWIQVGCILVGLAYSLRNGWRIWLEQTDGPRAALYGLLPLSVFLLVFSGWFVRFFAD